MPDMTSIQRQVLALCSLVSAGDRCDWGVLARQAHRERSLEGLMAGDMLETSARAHTTGWVIQDRLTGELDGSLGACGLGAPGRGRPPCSTTTSRSTCG